MNPFVTQIVSTCSAVWLLSSTFYAPLKNSWFKCWKPWLETDDDDDCVAVLGLTAVCK